MKNAKFSDAVYGICLVILMLLFLSIVVRFFVHQVLVEKLGMSNEFIDAVLFDAPELKKAAKAGKPIAVGEEKTSSKPTGIQWKEIYPFSDQDAFMLQESEELESTKRSGIEAQIRAIEEEISSYATDYLMGYISMTEAANRYKEWLQWNYSPYREYNGVVKLNDGSLTAYVEKRDTKEASYSTISLADYCADRDIDFIYIMAPYKICKFEDCDISGIVDFSNQNADEFLSVLRAAEVDSLDFREVIHGEKRSHHEMFYRTDHHWRSETGLWASKHLLQLMGEQYGFKVDPSVLDEERFDSVVYPAWFLGSHGKKVTLSVTTPDDFTLLTPDYGTDLHYVIPDLSIDMEGDFRLFLDMSQVDERDYYNKTPYAAYSYGDRPLIQIENKLLSDNGKVLLIHDSFGDAVIPFLALGVKHLDAIDLRHFTGSVQNYIETEKPDLVMILYHPGSIDSVDWTTSKSLFDYR